MRKHSVALLHLTFGWISIKSCRWQRYVQLYNTLCKYLPCVKRLPNATRSTELIDKNWECMQSGPNLFSEDSPVWTNSLRQKRFVANARASNKITDVNITFSIKNVVKDKLNGLLICQWPEYGWRRIHCMRLLVAQQRNVLTTAPTVISSMMELSSFTLTPLMTRCLAIILLLYSRLAAAAAAWSSAAAVYSF